MKKNLAILIIISVLIIACSPGINNVNEALDGIQSLDSRYNTNFTQEKVNTLTLTRENIELYLDDLEGLRGNIQPENEKQERWIAWLFDFRKQMLEAQHYFQQAWIGIGEIGRVSDGFRCSDAPAIKESTELLEKAWMVGLNSTKVLDSLLTENVEMQKKIGIGKNKPEIYNSRFKDILREARSNVIAMNMTCNEHVPTKYIDVTEAIQELENQTEVDNNGT